MQNYFRTIAVVAVSFLLMVFGMSTSYAQKYNKYAGSYNYQKGLEAFDEEDFEKAENAFLKELDEHGENGYAYVYLSYIHYYNEEYGRALADAENALKYIPKKDKEYKGICHYRKAGIYYALDRYDEAIAEYTAAIAFNPEDIESLRERAQVYYEQEKYDMADADYRAMMKITPNHWAACMGLGRNEVDRGNFESALDIFDNVIALYSNYARAYAFRAEAYSGLKRYNEAASDIVKALELDSDNKAFRLMMSVSDSAFVQMSTKLKAMSVNDANNSYWPYCLGVICERADKFNDAIGHYMKSLKLDEDAITCERISSCYEGMADWASAIEYMDKAISLNPKDSDLLMSKAEIFYEAGNVQKAVAMMDEYVELNPDNAGGYATRGWYKDGLNDIDGAVEDYTTALTLNPDIIFIYCSRAHLYSLKGEDELARKDYEMVVQKDTVPDNNSSAMFALHHLGRNEEAAAWMDKILESNDDNGSNYNAACLYSLMGDMEKSLYYLEQSFVKGYKSYHHMMNDSDLENVRKTEAFVSLMEKYFPEQVKEETAQEELVEYTERIVEVPFTRQGGVTQVKCSVNDLPLHFIFDTGAADVTISRVEATFMFKNGYLTSDDVVGKARYIDANGDVSVGTVLNIRNITFGGLELENVRASVVDTNNAPLLLGQSVLNRLGKIEIDYDRSVLKITARERVK